MFIDGWCDGEIERIKSLSDDRLQEIIDRPFKPSPFNSEFDFEKYCAQLVQLERIPIY